MPGYFRAGGAGRPGAADTWAAMKRKRQNLALGLATLLFLALLFYLFRLPVKAIRPSGAS